jgi:hypothetical protein
MVDVEHPQALPHDDLALYGAIKLLINHMIANISAAIMIRY